MEFLIEKPRLSGVIYKSIVVPKTSSHTRHRL